MKKDIFVGKKRAKEKDGQTNTVIESKTMMTTTRVDSHKTQLNTKPKEKGVTIKENSEMTKEKAKAKVAEKERTIMEIETPMTSKNLKSQTTVKECHTLTNLKMTEMMKQQSSSPKT
jgi:hypothetical protein